MGDMRPSNYTLWPWPTLLDKGERIKVKIPDPDGTLVVFGQLVEAPFSDGGKVKLKIDTLEPYHFEYHPNGGPVMVLSTYQFGSDARPMLAGISYSGWFSVGEGSQFGLHHDDLEANRKKGAALSAIDDPDGILATEEPGS